MVSRLAAPASLAPRSTPTTMPFAAAPRSPPTSITAWMAPWITPALACTSEVAMPPRPSIVFATVLLTALTRAPVTSPVPSMACTILSFTDSIKPTSCCFSIGHLRCLIRETSFDDADHAANPVPEGRLGPGPTEDSGYSIAYAHTRRAFEPGPEVTGTAICPQQGTLRVRREDHQGVGGRSARSATGAHRALKRMRAESEKRSQARRARARWPPPSGIAPPGIGTYIEVDADHRQVRDPARDRPWGHGSGLPGPRSTSAPPGRGEDLFLARRGFGGAGKGVPRAISQGGAGGGLPVSSGHRDDLRRRRGCGPEASLHRHGVRPGAEPEATPGQG